MHKDVIRQAILEDLNAHELRHHQIAEKHGVSISTVTRLAQKHNLQMGRGRKYNWIFEKSSPELAYIVGAYITDGTISKDERLHQYRRMVITNTNVDMMNKIYESMTKCNLHPKCGKPMLSNASHKGVKPKHTISTNVSMFARWLASECGYKTHIPKYLFTSPLEDKLAFLAGVIDGDGSVSLQGTISIAGIDEWLNELAPLLLSMGISTKGAYPTSVLPSGKTLYRISINRKTFLAAGGWCAIGYKMERALNAHDTRGTRPATKRYPCPACGELTIRNLKTKRCRKCYIASSDFHEHLVRIAPAGGKAGNKVRWSKQD